MTASVSILIVSFNSWPDIRRCIQSIVDWPPSSSFEVILVDNASEDSTVAEISRAFPSVRVIAAEKNDGYGVAINRAVGLASGSNLVLLNPDCEVTSGAFDRLLEVAARPDVAIVGPRLVFGSGEPQPSGRRFPSPWRILLEVSRLHLLLPRRVRARLFLGTYWDQSTSRAVDWVSGACHVIRRDVWERVGTITEDTFCGFDDFEYCYRAHGLGYTTWFCAEAEVTHHCGTSVRKRWTADQVDELAINNMYVLLPHLWPRWRVRLLALAEMLAALSDYVSLRLRGTRTGTASEKAEAERILARVRLLAGLGTGRRAPVRRCDPAVAR